MKLLYSFTTSLVLIFCFYLSIPPNNPSDYMQSVSVLVEDIGGNGSGSVILHEDETYILTCAHCMTNFFGVYMPVNIVQKIYRKNKLVSTKVYIAKVKAVDKEKDIALLYIDKKTHFNNTIHIEKGSYRGVGDEIWMIGSPYGVACYNTVTKGIIARYDYDNMLRYQVNCGVYFGGSGGGMFDEHGKYLGMFCSMRNPTLGYVIPSQTIRNFIKSNCPELLMEL